MIHDKAIRVGACDWVKEQWLGSFYPDDMPEDWQLSYYANEFSCVLVPEVKWRKAGEMLEQWVDDVPDGFQFYFLNSHKEASDDYLQTIFANKFAGFVNPHETSAVALIDVETKTLREWKDWLQSTKLEVVFLVNDQLTAKQMVDFQSLLELLNM